MFQDFADNFNVNFLLIILMTLIKQFNCNLIKQLEKNFNLILIIF